MSHSNTRPMFDDGSYLSLDSTGALVWFRADGTLVTVATSTGGGGEQFYQFTAALADASLAGKLFLSSTTANILKYYDRAGTPALHSIATLEDAQTFTATKTFSAIATRTDATYGIGTATNRFTSFAGSSDFSIYAASADANATASVQTAALKMGAGGATAMDVQLTRTSIGQMDIVPIGGNVFGSLRIASTGSAVASQLSMYRGAAAGSIEFLQLGADIITTNQFAINVVTNGGTARPLIFYANSSEAFRMTTTPSLQMATGINIVLQGGGQITMGATGVVDLSAGAKIKFPAGSTGAGAVTFANSPGGSGAVTEWIAITRSGGGTGYIPVAT